MRDKLKDRDRLAHMLSAIDTVLERFKLYAQDEIENDPILFYGFVKHLEIMGEATYMLTKEFKAEHPEVNWRIIEGLRHVLVHGYYHIKPIEIFNTIKNDLPCIYNQIETIYKSLPL